jgi:hypothetical protein
MKNLILFALLFSGLQFSSQAQQTSIGVKGGLVLSSISFDQPSTTFSEDNRTGYQVGLIFDHRPDGGLGFQIGALYSQRGGSDVKVNVVAVPIQLRLYPFSHFFVGGGIEGSMVTNDFPSKSIGLTAITEAGIYLSDNFYLSGGINFGLNETIELEGMDGIIGNGGKVDKMFTLSANFLF